MEGNPWGGSIIGEKGDGGDYPEGAAPEGSSADPSYMYNSHENGSANNENFSN